MFSKTPNRRNYFFPADWTEAHVDKFKFESSTMQWHPHYPEMEPPPLRPRFLDRMLDDAAALSASLGTPLEPFPYIRVDFFSMHASNYTFAEFTFTPSACTSYSSVAGVDQFFGCLASSPSGYDMGFARVLLLSPQDLQSSGCMSLPPALTSAKAAPSTWNAIPFPRFYKPLRNLRRAPTVTRNRNHNHIRTPR